MTNESIRRRPTQSSRRRLLRAGALGAFLSGTLLAAFGAPIAVSAATSTAVGSSSEARAFQHSAADKVAYLHDGSLLVGYYDGSNNGIVDHVTNPTTTPVSTQVDSISGGSEVTFYTLPSTNSTEIWVAVGSELTGGTKQEQVQYGVYNGTTFTWSAVTTVPGSLTSGRQDPSVTWTGKWLIDSWWDDTLGGNSDTIFYNWTTVKQGTSGWHVAAKSGTTLAALAAKTGTSSPATLAGATSINYNPTTGVAPATNDVLDFGTGTANSDVRTISGAVQETGTTAAVTVAGATSIGYTATTGVPAVGDVFTFGSGGTTDVRTVAGVAGTAPNYTLTVAALTFAHAMSEADTGPYTLTVAAFAHPHAVGEAVAVGAAGAGATSINYSGTAPAVGDNFQIGTAISNNGLTTCGTVSTPACDADFVQVTGFSGSTMTFSPALSNGHAVGEPVRIAALLLTSQATNSVQVTLRHSAKLGATIAVYGAHCQILTTTLLDGATDPSPTNWTTESAIDSGDDCENNFGGPQVAIDEATGNIHVFKSVTNSHSAAKPGIAYWLGTPDGTPMVSGIVNWSSRLVISSTTSATDPPDVAGAVDSTGRLYIYWASSATGGAIKFVTLDSPYTTPSAIGTVATNGPNPRYPHVPSQAPLTRGYVPLFYESGSSNPYSIMLTTLDTAPPTVPTGLSATGTTTPSVVLNWLASSDSIDGVKSYTVYKGGLLLASVSAPTLTYTDTAVSGSSSYQYTVDAVDAAGNHSAQTAPVTGSTLDSTPPSTPTGLTATPTRTPEVDLGWTASTDATDGVSSYTIYRNGAKLLTVSGTTLTYADTAVTQATAYTYTVDAVDAAGNHSPQSATVGATTPDITPPSVPPGLSAVATAGPSVTLTWTAATDPIDGVSGYTIYKGGTSIGTVSGSTLTYLDTAVVSGGAYTYTVDAFDAASNHSAQSAPATVNSPDTIPPTVPTGLSASVGLAPPVNLSWSASTDDVAVTGYTIYRNGILQTTVGASTLTYADSSVAGSTTYTYTVDAFDAAHLHSNQSAPLSFTTPAFQGWNRLGGILTSAPVVVSTGASSTDVFVRGSDNGLWQEHWNGTSWSGWASLGGILSSDPSAASSGPNRTDVFVRGTDNGLWQRTWSGTSWSNWASLGGGLTTRPAAIWSGTQLDVFARGTDNGLWEITWNGTSWSNWNPLGGILTSDPAVVSSGANHVDVFVRGSDNGLWQRTWNGTTWSNWNPLGGILSADPAAVATGSNGLDVFVRGSDNGLWERTWNGTTWSNWNPFGGVLAGAPEVSSCTVGHLDVYVIGSDQALYQLGYNGATWSIWQRVGGPWSSQPGAVCPAGSTSTVLVERGTDQGLWQSTYPGS